MQYLYAYSQCRQSNYDIAYVQLKDCVSAHSNEINNGTAIKDLFDQNISGDLPVELGTEELAECMKEQIIFYQEQNKSDLNKLREAMLQEVESVNKLFLWILSLPVALAHHEQRQFSKKKLSPQTSQRSLLNDNLCLKLLEEKLKEISLPGWEEHQDRLVQWYRELKQSDISVEVVNLDQNSEKLESDTRFISNLFKSVLWKSTSFQNFFEERNLGWIENSDIIKSLISKTLRTVSSDGLDLAPISYQLEDDQKFYREIFDTTLDKENWTEKLISEHAKNWEMDRIAQVDMILMKMAICEMINFPSIPVKVTINEYIEMSKRYSTPKSKKFINGILDVLANELTANGTIVKSGRGLIDNK